MAKHLNSRDIDAIVNLILGWNGKLTWERICEAAEPFVGKKPTRQSLSAHEQIESAYQAAKKGLKKEVVNPRPASLKIAAARVAKLERELSVLKEQNRTLLQQFVIWQYNAYKHGLKEHQLNAPLPKIDRERSDGDKR